jgi:hypothetical protein
MRISIGVGVSVMALLLAGCTSASTQVKSTSQPPTKSSSAPPSAGSTESNTRAVVSDVLNASMSLESYYSTNNSYPTTKSQVTASGNAAKVMVSQGDSLVIWTDGVTGYCILGSNPQSQYPATTPKLYDSDKGGLQVDGAKCSVKYPDTYVLP